MPIVTNTDTLAAANSTNSISFSRQMRLRRWARRALVSPWAITVVEAEPLGATADIVLCLPRSVADRVSRRRRGGVAPPRRPVCGGASELGFALQQVVHLDPDFGRAPEAGAQLLGREVPHRLVVVRRVERDVADLLGELRRVLEVELDELLDLGPRHRLLAHVDEDRAREWLVGPVHHRLERRRNALAGSLVDDRDRLELVLVLGVILHPHITQTLLVSR